MSWAKVIKTNPNAGNDLPNACHLTLEKTLCRNEFLYKLSSRDSSAIQPRLQGRRLSASVGRAATGAESEILAATLGDTEFGGADKERRTIKLTLKPKLERK